MSKPTVASLAALVADLTSRLTSMEKEIVSLKTELISLKSGSSPVSITTSESQPSMKKGNNPKGPTAYNEQVRQFRIDHPGVTYAFAQTEVSILNIMTKEGLTREQAEKKFAEKKAKTKKAAVEAQ